MKLAEREGFPGGEKQDARTRCLLPHYMVCSTARGWKGESRAQHSAVKPLGLRFGSSWTKRTNGRLPPAVVLSESIDTSTPTGKMIFTVLAAVGELERSTIRERVIAGQRAAKRRGVRFGRPTVEVDTALVCKLRSQGLSWRDIAEQTGTAKDTCIRSVERLVL